MINITRKWFLTIVVFLLGMILVSLVYVSRVIGNSVKQECRMAKARYAGDCVGALISTVQDESMSYRERNSAIWALGQLGDERGRDVILKYYNGGDIPDREPYNESLSQYEMKKALRLINGGLNITHLVWKR